MAAKPKSTAVAAPKVNLPAAMKEQLQAEAAALASKLAATTSGKGITATQSKKFRYTMDGETVEADSIKGIIVDFVWANAYYEGEYDKDNIVPPNCFAIGKVKNDDLTASTNAPDPQNGEGGDCSTCWANQWGSGKGKGKACKNTIKLGVLMADQEVRVLTISATALKAFGDYVRGLASAFQTGPYGVMTTFTFDPKSDYASVRCGSPIRLDEAQEDYALSRKEETTAMLLTEPDVSEFEEKVAAQKAPKGKGVKPPVSKGKSSRVSA